MAYLCELVGEDRISESPHPSLQDVITNYTSELPEVLLRDELGKYVVWAHDLFQTLDHASLDADTELSLDRGLWIIAFKDEVFDFIHVDILNSPIHNMQFRK